ncbi:hypothetical protein GCK72_019857 [Caenorhabditis remanei]|uniref:Seven TM Receptor n=1 Tax=Caenorhabditis remanei TaxID=31234 RepID=A0A6A5GFE5_CAERE|nr:hypothetical protein GCK72_019857 [Caenorhabditis remanei]KAF1753301.1 hypothetical protein GCK72_019857 [Caenorhabditis remanei]
MIFWAPFLRFVQQTSAIIAFFTNALLIWLIVNKSPKAMFSYKHIMVFTSVFEIFYAMIDLLIGPELITKSTYWIAETDSTKTWLPLSIVYPLLLAWGGSFGIALASFIVHFMFRYFTLVGNKKLVSGKSFMLYIWLSIPIISGIMYAVLTHIFLQENELMDTLISTEIKSLRYVHKNEMLYYGFSLYATLPNVEIQEIHWKHVNGISFIGTCITFSFFAMTFFAVKGYSAIKKLNDSNTNSSSLSKALQSQLFNSLVIQTAIPVILIHVPSTMILICSFMNTTEEVYGHVFTVAVSLFPVIDPLPSMIIIQPYRRAIKTCFRPEASTQNSAVMRVNPKSLNITSRVVTF